ncbi:7304_t:CDS:2, partial [Acaulospora colombiana]
VKQKSALLIQVPQEEAQAVKLSGNESKWEILILTRASTIAIGKGSVGAIVDTLAIAQDLARSTLGRAPKRASVADTLERIGDERRSRADTRGGDGGDSDTLAVEEKGRAGCVTLSTRSARGELTRSALLGSDTTSLGLKIADDPHFSQLPEELRKNPSAQVAHWVELPPDVAVVKPGEQVQVEPLQTPLAQLQLDGALEGTATLRHSPVPVMPSSHRLQVGSHSVREKRRTRQYERRSRTTMTSLRRNDETEERGRKILTFTVRTVAASSARFAAFAGESVAALARSGAGTDGFSRASRSA